MANNKVRTKFNQCLTSEDTLKGLNLTVAQLRSELELERKTVRRLRCEKAYEVQLAREQEKTKAGASIKEIVTKMQQTKEQEAELLKCRNKAEINKVIKQKDKELKKLRKDLVKCQDDLKEKTYKSGLSTSARAAFDLERSKLLQVIKELNASKKQTEDALLAANEAEKQKSLELQRLQETMRIEIAKVNKEANIEITRLLQELKARENSLIAMRRNNSGAKGSARWLLGKHSGVNHDLDVSFENQTKSWEKNFLSAKEAVEAIKCKGNLQNFNLQRKLYEIEKQLKFVASVNRRFTETNNDLNKVNKELEQSINSLYKDNKSLKVELKSANGEIKRLKDLMNSNGISNLTLALEDLSSQIKEFEEKANSEKQKTSSMKVVRFLLPDDDYEQKPDGKFTYEEHNSDERGGKQDKGGGGEEGRGKEKHQKCQFEIVSAGGNCNLEDWHIQKESLNLVIQALEEKLTKKEEFESVLKLKLQEACDLNDELEFQILELENSADEKKMLWQKESELLKSQLNNLSTHAKVTRNEPEGVMERSVGTQCNEDLVLGDLMKQQNTFRDLTDDHKLSVRAKMDCTKSWKSNENLQLEGNNGRLDNAMDQSKVIGVATSNFVENRENGSDLMVNGVRETEWMAEIDSLKRKLARSQMLEQQTKDQLLLLEQEKNRHIKLLQHQIESIENNDEADTLSHCPLLNKQSNILTQVYALSKERPNPEGLEDDNKQETVILNTEKASEQVGKLVRLKLDTTLNWIPSLTDHLSCMTPLTGDCNLPCKLEYNDERHEQLCRQISDLEREREFLLETVQANESITRELQLQIDKLQHSENDLQKIIERLEKTEEQLRCNIDNMAVCSEDLQQQLEHLKMSEVELLLELKKSRSTELELKLKIDEMAEEKYACEINWKRRLSEAEIENKLLQEKTKELEDQLGEHEILDCIAKQKLTRLEKTENYFRKELEDAKREHSAAVNHISELEFDKELLVQKLEKANMDYAVEISRIGQERDAMSVEIVENLHHIKGLEQTIGNREATILSLKSKLMKLEVNKMCLHGHHLEWNECENQQNVGKQKLPQMLNPLENYALSDFNTDCSCKEFDCYISSANKGRPVLNDKTNNKASSLTPSLSTHQLTSDEVESADEASEIIDDDDGGQLPSENRNEARVFAKCWNETFDRITNSSSMESICDSGMESSKQDVNQKSTHEYSVIQNMLSMIGKPNAFRFSSQNQTKSFIPVSVRYLMTRSNFSASYDQSLVPIHNTV